MPAHPSELTAHDCLLYLGDHAGSWTFARNAKRKSDERVGVNITGSLKANNSEVLRDALLAGLGIGLLPDFSIQQGDAPTPFTSCDALPPKRVALAQGGPSRRAAREKSAALVHVLPDWQVQDFLHLCIEICF